MDFKQIEAFVKVVDLASFSRAAEAMYLSQPSVSTYISALERELDCVLVSRNRSTKEVSPTFAGKVFYEAAVQILAQKEAAIQRVRHLSGEISGEISILASTVPSQYILPRLLADFARTHPNISFKVSQADSADVTSGIAAGKAEIGMTGGILDNSKCDYAELLRDRLILIGPRDEFDDAVTYRLEHVLYSHNFVQRAAGSGTRALYEEFFLQDGIDLNRIAISGSFDDTQSTISAVMAGLGVSVVSRCAADAFLRQDMLAAINLERPLPARKFHYVLKKNFPHSHLVRLLVDFLDNQPK